MKKGFTIIELLVAITIIGILVAAASLKFNQARTVSRDGKRMSDILLISKAVETAAAKNGGMYPGKQVPDDGNKGIINNRISDMCTDQINDSLFKPVSPTLDVSELGGKIPKDPLSIASGKQGSPYPLFKCAFAVDGYIYESHYIHSQYMNGCKYPSPSTGNSCSMAIQLGVKYLNIVALENQLPSDNFVFREFTQKENDGDFSTERDGPSNTLVVYGRYTYYVPGPYCGDACYTD